MNVNFGEGEEYNLQISARDKEDNTSAPSTFNLVVDQTSLLEVLPLLALLIKEKILNVADKRYTNHKR